VARRQITRRIRPRNGGIAATIVVKWVDRFPVILWGGAALPGWTAAKMIASELLVAPWFAAHAAATRLARERTPEFLRRHVG